MPASIPIKHGGTFREPRHNFGAGHLLTQHDLSSSVEANQVQCVLAGIDTNGDDCGVKFAWHGRVPPDCPPQVCSRVWREHGRSIPFSDIWPDPSLSPPYRLIARA